VGAHLINPQIAAPLHISCRLRGQRRHPAMLIDQVMDQRLHIPLRARSASMPLLRAHPRNQPCEPPPAAAGQLDEVICH
jgi:hypothetical protein